MEQSEIKLSQGRSGILIVILVFVGIAILAAGGYLAWSKRRAEGPVTSGEITEWCKIRAEWAEKAVPLSADIMLKSVSPTEKQEFERLTVERNKLCNEFGRQVQDLHATDPVINAVEVALIKEGKVRANISVEIYNLEAQLEAQETNSELRKTRDKLKNEMGKRIQAGKEQADREVAEALAPLKGQCAKIFRGPATDAGTADNPFVSWDELDMRRTTAIKHFDDKIKKLEPQEEYANRVYHEMVRQYRPFLMNCYKRAKARRPDISESMGLRVRLKRSGEVKTLAIEWMDNKEESLLDCLLEKAAKWRLPVPDPEIEMVIVTIDFSRL
jgi:hypothetical protein